MAASESFSHKVNIRDISPLSHITADLTKALHNYEAILNGIVTWNSTDNPNVTVRLLTDSEPFFVDYTFPSRKAYAGDSSVIGTSDITAGHFGYGTRLTLPATRTDLTKLRITLNASTRVKWRLYEDAYIYQEDSDIATSAYEIGTLIAVKDGDASVIYMTRVAVSEGDSISAASIRAVDIWKSSMKPVYQETPGLVTYVRNVTGTLTGAYVLIDPSMTYGPTAPSNGWHQIAYNINAYDKDRTISTGQLCLFSKRSDHSDAALYAYIGESFVKKASEPVDPFIDGELDTANWVGPVMVVPVKTFDDTNVVSHTPKTDIKGYVLEALSNEPSQVSILGNVVVREGTSEPHKGLGVFNTCNYISWPQSEMQLWHDNKVYTDTDEHTAKMIFHHADDDVKMVNIINYDGPDLDRGLAIYLPAEDLVTGENGEPAYVEAQDGATFEFMFRIWPNTKLNGAETADLIINKAQIYVYTVPTSDSEEGASILVKLSMARLTNFYLWAENVAVPNRPVFYKAKFIYSRDAKAWKTVDYYQIPDHIFLSPKGFVDPSVRGEDGVYGNSDPFSGVETAGFPLMQDPFGGMDLSPIKLNRIETES